MPVQPDKNQLKKIDPFSTPLEIWDEREPTNEEVDDLISKGEWRPFIKIKSKLNSVLKSAYDAAKLIAANKDEVSIDDHVISYLNKNTEYNKWRSFMPYPTPEPLISYQEDYPPEDFEAINSLVSKYGILIPEGQVLFHGRAWPLDKLGEMMESFLTDRVLSTSFCPRIALNNGEWMGKAFDAGRIDIMVITIKNKNKKAFVFSLDEGANSHEMEVLFERGIQLNLIGSSTINMKFKSCKSTSASSVNCKFIVANVLHVEMM
ncbi:hypothetical protein [Pantoea ananatis]|uniref:hypothetical protein n=1 Tax=Pantoea ananas TaxID=553 RepID=UPI0024B6CE88|nr:hypothetical protein [Pantoea ananatis]MDJ0034145.1 hypothetical protein [Pantoea ananatis]